MTLLLLPLAPRLLDDGPAAGATAWLVRAVGEILALLLLLLVPVDDDEVVMAKSVRVLQHRWAAEATTRSCCGYPG